MTQHHLIRPPLSTASADDIVIGLGDDRNTHLEMTRRNLRLLDREMARIEQADPIKALMAQVMRECRARGLMQNDPKGTTVMPRKLSSAN